MTNTNPVHRYPTITPHLAVDDPAAALDFYERAFGARELVRLALPDGTIAHAEMLVGDALVTLGKAIPEYHLVAPSPDQPVHVSITWFTDDADAVYARAMEAGATAVTSVADQFHGDRVGSVRCPFGHRWIIATHLEDVPYDEQQRRLTEMMTKPAS
ncbi:MAG TPA: VOC family protein [Acidimicrobiales bacterium]|jgi:PhnB protein|nr:VOC family protein [Acidimicrobiales bacterium]